MPSLLNGLSTMGAGIAAFAGTAGLEQQRSDLARQSAILADSLATTRETGLEQLRQTGQAANTAAVEAGANTRNAASIAGSAANTATSEAGATSRNAATNQAAMERTQLEVGKPTGELQIARALAGPDATQDQLQEALQTVIAGRAKYTFSPATQPDPADPTKTVSGVNVMNTRTGETEFRATGTNPNKGSSGATLSPETRDQLADRIMAGDNSALTGLGYGNAGAENRAAVQEAVTKKLADAGLKGADLVAKSTELFGERAGARTAGTREANVGMAVTEAQLFMPLALEASKNVDRTSFPSLNSILQAAEKGTGDENVVRLAVATNSLVNAYARAITPSGIPTEGNQTRARELLDKAWSQGQYAAAIDQLGKEMKAAKASPIQQQEEQRSRVSGRPGETAPASATSPAVPSWVKPGDQYSPSRGQARGAGGATYGPPQ